MWVYQSPVSLEIAPVSTDRPESIVETIQAEKQQPKAAKWSLQPIEPANALQHSPRRQTLRRNICWLLVAAFLIGSAASGILWSLSEEHLPDWLQFYLQSWRGLFTITDVHTSAGLFGAEYLSLTAAATLLLLSGFSALGPVLIFLFTMFYGLGFGLLFVQLLVGPISGKGIFLLLTASFPTAAAAAGLCFLGIEALCASNRIRAFSFFSAKGPQISARPGSLIRGYLLTIVLFLPLCGVSSALACMGSRL